MMTTTFAAASILRSVPRWFRGFPKNPARFDFVDMNTK